jgi:prepilin-type N-terminal cleavage/methylation domain-containing protein
MKKDKHRSGFTLIELLVVVGIIAILALIALPNFLEAQTRAKVARVRNDLRVVVTALELYRVDTNRYPSYHYVNNTKSNIGFSFHVGGESTSIGTSPVFTGPNPLTSPISYLTRFPPDVFGARGANDPTEGEEFYYVNWDYAMELFPNPGFGSLQRGQGSWRLHSPGPDRLGPDSDISTGEQIPYEPTNGTISGGDLVRTQK